MSNKFKNVPVEWDTKILFQQEIKLEDKDVIYQIWDWDGIKANSIIFISKDIDHQTDEELKNIIKKMPLYKANSEITLKRDESFTFVNFNFETAE